MCFVFLLPRIFPTFVKSICSFTNKDAKRLCVITINRVSECASVLLNERRDCGFSGITEQECLDRDCCWDTSHAAYRTCFYNDGDYLFYM